MTDSTPRSELLRLVIGGPDTGKALAGHEGIDGLLFTGSARTGIARAWFGSVADGLIRESGIPVLVVRAPSVGTALTAGFHFKRILVWNESK